LDETEIATLKSAANEPAVTKDRLTEVTADEPAVIEFTGMDLLTFHVDFFEFQVGIVRLRVYAWVLVRHDDLLCCAAFEGRQTRRSG
jgi:hypothetical protein